MELKICQTVDELIKETADYFLEVVNKAITESGECNVVLSGGNTPKSLYELLSMYPYRSDIDWDKIYFFFGDERCVPFNDPENNGQMVKKTLFDPLKIADSRIF